MKKMPRKFSQGGAMQPKDQPKPAEAKKPVDNMPDWAKKDLEAKNADAKTKQGYEKATAKDRLAPKGFKKGGSIKKFAEGGRFSESDPDIYERARRFVETGKKDDDDAGPAGAIKEPPGAEKAKPKAKPAAKKAATGGKGGGAGATEPDVPYGRRDAPTLGNRTQTRSEAKESPKVKDNESDSDLSVEPRRYLSRGRNYSATGDMSPQAEKAVDAGMTLAALTGIGRAPAMLRSLGRSSARQADDIMSSGAARAAQNRIEGADRAKAIEDVREALKRSGASQRAEKEAARSARRTPRDADEMRFADEGNPNFKRGGKVAKYAKGGGVESKGKTKGTVVKMAKGGSVKGWGISRGAKACKMV